MPLGGARSRRRRARPSDEVIRGFVEGTDFLPAIERHTPELLEEVRGIADGSGLTFEAVYAAQLMDEEWWIIAEEKANHHCSSLGVVAEPGRRAFVAQNMDLVAWNEGFQVLLTIRGEQGRAGSDNSHHGRHDRPLRHDERGARHRRQHAVAAVGEPVAACRSPSSRAARWRAAIMTARSGS